MKSLALRITLGFFSILLVSTFIGVSSDQAKAANVSCNQAMNAVVGSALSQGDISLAAKARSMCNYPCDSIGNFYTSVSLSSYLSSMVLDAYRTCLSQSIDNGGGGSGGDDSDPSCSTSIVVAGETVCLNGTGPITSLSKPTVSGKTKIGSTLRVSEGSWSNGAVVYGVQWLSCNRVRKTSTFKQGRDTVSNLNVPTPECLAKPVKESEGPSSFTYKISSKLNGKYIAACVWFMNEDHWGGYCTKTTTKVTR